MGIGKTIRLSNIIDPKDGRCVMFAADHNFLVGPIRGLESVEKTLKRAFEGRLDAVMLSPGQAKRLGHMFGGRGSPALVVRGDWANCFRERIYALPTRKTQEVIVANPRDLVRMGATGAVFYFFTGYGEEEDQIHHYERLKWFLKNCEKVELPCLVTVIPMGEKVTGANFVNMLETGVRLAVEAGADILEVPYTQDINTFKRIVDCAKGIPVLCAGGPKAAKLRDSLEIVVELLEAGASGVVFGRQVFQSDDPASYLNMLYALIHERKSVDELLGLSRVRAKIKLDPEKCTGCGLCEYICSFTHEGNFSPWKARLHMKKTENGYKPVFCNLCGLCVKSCPSNALEIDQELGYVKLSTDRCTGCETCVRVCPEKVIKFDKDERMPLFCDKCEGSPQCVTWCPVEALTLEVF